MEFAWMVLLTIGLLFDGGRAQVKKPLADDLIQPAAKWLLDRRDEWGRDTPRALLAMRRASTNWDRNSLQSQLLTQKFDIELLLTLLKIQKQQSRNRRSTSQKQDGKSEDKHYSRSQDKKTDSSDWNRRNTDADSRFSHRHQDPKTDSSDWKLHNEDEKRYDANRKEDSDDSNWKRHNGDEDSRYSHRQDKTDDSDWKRRNDEERPYIDRRDESDSFEKNRSESDTVEPGSMTSPFQEQANILSRFALTLAAMCRNPRDFYENDIIGPILSLEDEEKVQPFTYAFHTLAVCAGGGHVKRRRVMRLLDIINQPAETHNIDVLAIVAMTLSCLSETSAKHRHLRNYLEDPLKTIASQQQADGSFDHNPSTTALAIQALEMPDRLNINSSKPILLTWRPEAAEEWFRNLQKADGSFGDLFTTSEVLIALSGPLKSYAALSLERCLAEEETMSATTPSSIPKTTTISSAAMFLANKTEMIQFTYVIWVGQDRSEVYTIKLTVPANSTFFEAMKVAAEADPHFQFSTSIWPNGHYIHTIAGHRDQNIGFNFWLLFRLRFMPDPLNPPPPTHEFVAVGGVDDEIPKDGDYFLFWYKNV